jgi:hypothetical protein
VAVEVLAAPVLDRRRSRSAWRAAICTSRTLADATTWSVCVIGEWSIPVLSDPAPPPMQVGEAKPGFERNQRFRWGGRDRANILRSTFTSAGVGYAFSGGRIWVAVEFGG